MTGTAAELPFALVFGYDDAGKANWSPDTHTRSQMAVTESSSTP